MKGINPTKGGPSAFDLRLAILLLLHGRYGDIISTFAPVCSSWSIVNLATSQRSILTPLGNCRLKGVIQGNRMISRTAH